MYVMKQALKGTHISSLLFSDFLPYYRGRGQGNGEENKFLKGHVDKKDL